MMDPASFRDRETWLAYLMGFRDGREEFIALIKTEGPHSAE